MSSPEDKACPITFSKGEIGELDYCSRTEDGRANTSEKS